MKNILVDIDNTLTGIDYTLERMANFLGKEPKTRDDAFTFNIANIYGVSGELEKKFWEEEEIDLVMNSKLNEYVLDHLERTKQSRDKIHIVTARDPYLKQATKDWLKKHKIEYNSLECIGKGVSKEEWSYTNKMSFDIVYEDNPVYLKRLPKETHKVVVDYPYNRDVKADQRLVIE